MTLSAIGWFVFNLISIAFLAFYSMMEMACVSFNKVHLQYYVSQNDQRAIWLTKLLQNPAMLFGTTLIGVNLAMVVGSECAREFYRAIGLSPDLAPLTQVAIVLIFGELAPMFAARSFPEHVGMLGAGLLYASAKLMTPLLWCVKGLTKLCQWIIGGREETANIFLTQDELQKIIEEQEEFVPEDELNVIAANIFTIRKKTARQIMTPIASIPSLPSTATTKVMHQLLMKHDANYVPIYHKDLSNIVGIVLPRDVIRASSSKRIREYAKQPWFVTGQTSLTQLLRQFRRNNQTVAVILDEKGRAEGIVELDDVVEEVFGKTSFAISHDNLTQEKQQLIDRTFPSETLVGDFNQKFDVILDKREALTLAELMKEGLEHSPQEGDRIMIGSFELIIKETSFLEIKSITIRSKIS